MIRYDAISLYVPCFIQPIQNGQKEQEHYKVISQTLHNNCQQEDFTRIKDMLILVACVEFNMKASQSFQEFKNSSL